MDPVVTLKRPSPDTDYSLCIFCQTHTPNGILSKASDHGLVTVRHAATTRRKLRDSNNVLLIDRLDNVLDSAEACVAQYVMPISRTKVNLNACRSRRQCILNKNQLAAAVVLDIHFERVLNQ